MSRHALRRGLLLPATLRSSAIPVALVPRVPHGARFATTVIEPEFWKSLVPKPLRRSGAPKKPRSKEWNPATFFIVVFLLIGSMSINLISVKQDYTNFVRQSDARIGVLREVVEKLQRGEEVDVERLLGTSDAEREIQWEEALKEIERGEPVRGPRRKSANPTPTESPETTSPKAVAEADAKQVPTPGRATFF
ncbi:hypothetical protein GQ53DRAFT_642141 [Thozetella sp. PMI_491]|nr:hypothetical protein GQ53DRAFT_642141 [Thozetella sp. PMI_491]